MNTRLSGMKTLIWIAALLCIGLWSLLSWAVYALLGLDPSWVDGAKPLLQELPYGAILDQWIPGWQPMALALLDLTRTSLGWLGGIGGVVVWVLWALVGGFILLLAALLSFAVGKFQRGSAGPGAGPQPPSGALRT